MLWSLQCQPSVTSIVYLPIVTAEAFVSGFTVRRGRLGPDQNTRPLSAIATIEGHAVCHVQIAHAAAGARRIILWCLCEVCGLSGLVGSCMSPSLISASCVFRQLLSMTLFWKGYWILFYWECFKLQWLPWWWKRRTPLLKPLSCPFFIFCKLCFDTWFSLFFSALRWPQLVMVHTTIIALVVKENKILAVAKQMFLTYFSQAIFLTAETQ